MVDKTKQHYFTKLLTKVMTIEADNHLWQAPKATHKWGLIK